MPAAAETAFQERAGWGLSASIALHVLLLLAAFAAAPVGRLASTPEEESVPVDILSPQQFAAATRPAPPVLTAPAAPAKPPAEPLPEVQGMVRAATMLSAKALANPRAAKARAELASFAASERILQLCNLEAMEQIEAWNHDFRPDNLVAYARSNEKLAGNMIKAGGAAFHSDRGWYDLAFNCELSPAHDKVVAFEFKVGKPVPEKEWEELGLPAGEAQD